MTETPDGQPPRPPLLQIIAAQSHVLEGRPERGIRELLSLVRETPDDPILLASLGWAHGLAGHRDAALELLDALRERRATERLRPFLLARVYAGIGENDQAFAWLDRSVAEHDPFLIMIRSDQTVASLREDPRFGQILRRLNLP